MNSLPCGCVIIFLKCNIAKRRRLVGHTRYNSSNDIDRSIIYPLSAKDSGSLAKRMFTIKGELQFERARRNVTTKTSYRPLKDDECLLKQ